MHELCKYEAPCAVENADISGKRCSARMIVTAFPFANRRNSKGRRRARPGGEERGHCVHPRAEEILEFP